MGQADGTIVIDTTITDEGFVAGTKEMEAAARRMAESVSGIGDKAKVALQKQANAFAKLNSQYAEQTRKVETLKEKVDALREEKIPTQEYTDLNKEIDSVNKKLDAAIEREIKFMETGGKQNSRTFKGMEYDIDMLREKLEEAQKAKTALESSGGSYMSGADTESGQKVVAQYAAAQAALEDTNNRVRTSFDSLKASVKDYEDKAKKATKSSGGLQKGIDKAGMSFKKMLSYAFGIRSLFALFNRLRSAVGEGMKNLVQYSGDTNNTVSGLMSSLTQLKNALATAFAPILTMIAPALNTLISLLTTAANAVAQFLGTDRQEYIRESHKGAGELCVLVEKNRISSEAGRKKPCIVRYDRTNWIEKQGFRIRRWR